MKQGLLHDLLTRGLDENSKLRDSKAHPEQFKDSPLGRIPKEWGETKIAEMGNWRGGSTPSKSVIAFWQEGDIPWLTPKDFDDETLSNTQDKITQRAMEQTGLVLFDHGDIAVVFRSGILRHTFPVSVISVPFTVNQDIKVLSALSGYDCRFAFFLLKSLESKVLRYAVKVGTTVESIGLQSFSSIRVVKPPLKEQGSIAAVLGVHDVRIRTEEAIPRQTKTPEKGPYERSINRQCQG